MAGRGLEGEKE